MRTTVVLMISLCTIFTLSAKEPKTKRRGRYYKSGNVERIYLAYKSKGKWVRHGAERVYYDHPKDKKGKRRIASITNWSHGVRDGVFREMYADGITIKTDGNYRDGKREGQRRSFFPSGAKKEVLNYKKGRLHGTLLKYSIKGQLLVESNYDRGIKHGISRKWHPNGTRKSIAKYVDGKKNGAFLTFFANSNPKSRTKFKFGVKHGMEKLWQKTGIPISEIQYVDGKKQGLVRLFHPNGKLKSEIEYKGAKIHGSCKEYYATGHILRDASYEEGLLHGEETNWYPTGGKRSTATFRFGKKDGLLTVYNTNKQPRFQHTIRQDKKHGPAIFFSKDGKPIAQGDFAADEPFEGTFVLDIEERENQYEIITVRQGEVTGVVFYENDKPMDGPIKENYSGTGELKRKATYRNGKLHGVETLYFRNRRTERTVTWIDGKADGLVTQWHRNGKKMWEAQFSVGIKDGYEKAWDARARLLCDGHHKAGKPWNGTLPIMDKKTKKQVIRLFKNGVESSDLPDNIKKMIKGAKLSNSLRLHGKRGR